MRHSHLPSRIFAPVALLLLATSCGGPELVGLEVLLTVRDGVPDPSGEAQYVVDFGEVALGSEKSLPLYVRNDGRTSLVLQPPKVSAPFAVDVATVTFLEQKAERELSFTFRPRVSGEAQGIVQLESDGGNVTVRLRGKAVAAAPGDCQFVLEPESLDFGHVRRGTTAELQARITNPGSSACNIRRLQLQADGDPAFTLPNGPMLSHTIEAGGELVVPVAFRPERYAALFTSTVLFRIGPPDRVVSIPVTGGSPEPCPGALPDGTCPVASESVYVNTPTRLLSHDPATGTTQSIGALRANGSALENVSDIAIDRNGTLLGAANNKLYVFNPNTGEGSLLTDLGFHIPGLTFLPDGRLVASGERVVVVDRVTGATLQIIVPEGRFSTSGDIIALPDGMLYWVVSSTSGGDRLVRIDPDTGSTTVVGNLGVGRVYGLAYANSKLFGYTDGGEVVTIDPATATLTDRGPLPGEWWGATTNPVLW